MLEERQLRVTRVAASPEEAVEYLTRQLPHHEEH
jgi:hypothetical protein